MPKLSPTIDPLPYMETSHQNEAAILGEGAVAEEAAAAVEGTDKPLPQDLRSPATTVVGTST